MTKNRESGGRRTAAWGRRAFVLFINKESHDPGGNISRIRLIGKCIVPSAAHRLKQAREIRGISQGSFAKELKIPLRSFQYYERGDRPIPIEVLTALREIGISVDWLLTGDGDMNAPIQEEYARMEALVRYWEANYQLLEANQDRARADIASRYGENTAREVFDSLLPIPKVELIFPHTTAQTGELVAVAEKGERKNNPTEKRKS